MGGAPDREVLAIIPARGGSKGIPRKNLAPLAGRPLLAYAVEAARGARTVGRVLVSTDDAEIAAVARDLGAEAPFLRPAELADDAAATLPVLVHALAWLREREGYRPEAVALLEPTSPLRRAAHVDACVDLLWASGADSVVTVCPVERNPYNILRADTAGRATRLLPGPNPFTRRQQFQDLVRVNGAVYVSRRAAIEAQGRLLGEDLRVVRMDAEESVNVDTPLDLRLAAWALERRAGAGAAARA